eukprot:TRINITY_DN1453_c0_g1_i4.p1 TRINITY_DN1453_c0_g1~~TRINITY_DN1453_c0_g1_i4.p1  ORF type:complete len:657 (-),score=143.34 TRINITY_DN1453_c0_g1_i4:64-2034(-)
MAAMVSTYGGGVVGPTTKLELHFECKDLKNLDTLSKSDPQVRVFIKDRLHPVWTEIGKTEMIKDTLNPKFTQTITVDYYFEEVQHIQLLVIDVDKPDKQGFEKRDLIGEIETTLALIVGSKGSTLVKNLKHPTNQASTQHRGIIIVTAEEIVDQKQCVKFHIAAKGLDKKDFFGKSDPFLRISRSRGDGQWMSVHQTEEIKKTLDPIWKPFEITMQKLNGGDLTKALNFQVYDWNKNGKEDFIGQFQASLGDILEGVKTNKDFVLMNPELQHKKKGYKGSGVMKFIRCEVCEIYSFLDYLRGGCGLSLIVGVDFTASNGDPNLPSSLHYRNPNEPNEYSKAIMAVGEILGAYDSDNMYPCFGFGAKIGNQVSHCFALGGDPTRPEVYGVGGLLNAYHTALHNVELYGPTNFAPLINQAISIASQDVSQEHQNYHILLIITDGEITDIGLTIRAVIKASALPLSIVIVGVGNADFTNMALLDADEKALSADGVTALRDIVQFVPLRNFKDQHYSRLAAEVLAEVPQQVVEFFKIKNIKPNKPLAPSFNPTESVNAAVFTGTWGQSIAPPAPLVQQQSFAGAYPPPAGAYPPPSGAYPPQPFPQQPPGAAYPPPSFGYPAPGMASAYPPQASQAPPAPSHGPQAPSAPTPSAPKDHHK